MVTWGFDSAGLIFAYCFRREGFENSEEQMHDQILALLSKDSGWRTHRETPGTERKTFGVKDGNGAIITLTAPEAGTFPLVDHHHLGYMSTDLLMPFAVG
jgi:hypothetical protein